MLGAITTCSHCRVFHFAGERTFGVLTKLDLMDKGTNALDVSKCSLRMAAFLDVESVL